MKAGWTTKRLGEVCAFDKDQGIHRGLPYVGMEHIDSHTGRFIGSHSPQAVKSATFRFSSAHVLYGRLRPYLNKAIAPDFEGHCSTEIFPIKPSPAVDRHYLLYWLLADETTNRINETCSGARMPRADMNEVLGFEFPLPPLPEQRRIVALLDEAFAGLSTAAANAERNLDNARELFESHLAEVFSRRGDGWVERRLGEIIRVQNGYAFKSDDYGETGYFVVRIGNVQDGKITLDNPRFIQLRDKRLERFVLDSGDILVSLTGNIGRVGEVRPEHLPAVLNQRVARVTVGERGVSRDFVFWFLRTRLFRESLQRAGHGAAQQNVSTAEIAEVQVWIPESVTQQALVQQLDVLSDETGRLSRLYEQKQAALAALKRSLLHQAFSGAL